MNRLQRKYCWKQQKIDARDYKFSNRFKLNTLRIPSKVDLRTQYTLPDPYDQGSLGSCTANAVGFCYHFNEIVQKNDYIFMPSRLFIYYNERVIQGTVNEDSGAEIRDGIKTINKTGVCDEKIWPYNINKFTTKPTQNCYNQALLNKSISYYAVDQDLISLKTAIVGGFPIAFGFYVYASFESQNVEDTGVVPMPNTKVERILGGHAVVIVGFDDTRVMPDKSKGCFIVRNSWGDNWGDHGYFYMPYAYVTSKLSSDFWVITEVSEEVVPVPTPIPTPPNSIDTVSIIDTLKNAQQELLNVQNVKGEITTISTLRQNIIKELNNINSIKNNVAKEAKNVLNAKKELAKMKNIQKEMAQIDKLQKNIISKINNIQKIELNIQNKINLVSTVQTKLNQTITTLNSYISK